MIKGVAVDGSGAGDVEVGAEQVGEDGGSGVVKVGGYTNCGESRVGLMSIGGLHRRVGGSSSSIVVYKLFSSILISREMNTLHLDG